MTTLKLTLEVYVRRVSVTPSRRNKQLQTWWDGLESLLTHSVMIIDLWNKVWRVRGLIGSTDPRTGPNSNGQPRESLTYYSARIRAEQKCVYCLCVPVKYKIPSPTYSLMSTGLETGVVVARKVAHISGGTWGLCRHPGIAGIHSANDGTKKWQIIYLSPITHVSRISTPRYSTFRELFLFVYFLALCLLTGQGIFKLKGYRASDRASCAGNRTERPGNIVAIADGSSIITCMWQVEPTDWFERSDTPKESEY